jgi:hypothetical protein
MPLTDVWPVISSGFTLPTEEVILHCNPKSDVSIKKIKKIRMVIKCH